jgi:hypothetical protein
VSASSTGFEKLRIKAKPKTPAELEAGPTKPLAAE